MNMTSPTVRVIASAKSWIESEAVRQLEDTAKLPGMRLAIGLPDLHPGKGHPVGAAFVTEKIIYPYLIGNDIGCGMGLWQTELSGRKIKRDRWTEKLFDLESSGDVRTSVEKNSLAATPFDASLGTIGGGNHFAELQALETIFEHETVRSFGWDTDYLVLLVHSGSRGLGESILRQFVDEHRNHGVAADSTVGLDYLAKHDHALHWAKLNRTLIARRFAACLSSDCQPLWDASHNQIQRTEANGRSMWIHRKGATPADAGPLVIPGSRGTLSYLVQPIGDTASCAWSLAHGAGRKWTRTDARGRIRDRFRADELTQTELGSRVICENRDLLYEEAPQAYKNIETVIQDLIDAGLIRVLATLRPVITYKTRAVRR